MLKFMQHLEPRHYKGQEIVHADMEEVNEIIFISTGEVSLLSFRTS